MTRSIHSIFLTWERFSTRSHNQAKHFGAHEVYIYPVHGKKSAWRTVWRYLVSCFVTLRRLRQEKPDVIFTLNQPLPLVALVSLYSRLTGVPYLLDSHSGPFNDPRQNLFRVFYRDIARRALVNINTNTEHQRLVESWGGRSVIIGDVPIDHERAYPRKELPWPSIAMVASYGFDEPIAEVIAAAAVTPEVNYFMTGSPHKLEPALRDKLPANVNLTGFLSDEDYQSLLVSAQAVMVLTTRDHTMQRGAYEAMSLERPIITSDFEVLRTSFGGGAVYVDNTAAGIAAGVRDLVANHKTYEDAIKTQRVVRREHFEVIKREVLATIENRIAESGG